MPDLPDENVAKVKKRKERDHVVCEASVWLAGQLVGGGTWAGKLGRASGEPLGWGAEEGEPVSVTQK